MVKKWLHFNDKIEDLWINYIQGAIHQWNVANTNEDKDEKIFRKELSEICLHISIRINMLQDIQRRIRLGYDLLYNVIITHEPKHIFTKNKEGYALNIDHNKLYNFLIDIDSILFEINSCCELIGNFLGMVYKHIDGSIISKDEIGKRIQIIIKDAGEDVNWYKLLDWNRNYFIHEGAPFIAVDVSQKINGKFDLIIMRENLNDFSDESKFIRLSKLESIVQGFEKGNLIIREHILNLYRTKLQQQN